MLANSLAPCGICGRSRSVYRADRMNAVWSPLQSSPKQPPLAFPPSLSPVSPLLARSHHPPPPTSQRRRELACFLRSFLPSFFGDLESLDRDCFRPSPSPSLLPSRSPFAASKDTLSVAQSPSRLPAAAPSLSPLDSSVAWLLSTDDEFKRGGRNFRRIAFPVCGTPIQCGAATRDNLLLNVAD